MPHEPPVSGPQKRPPQVRPVWDFLTETYDEWIKDRAMTLGAALAFYTTFSLAPLLIIVIAIFGFILGEKTVQGEILRRVHELIGPQGAAAVKMMIKHAYRPGTGLGLAISRGFVEAMHGTIVAANRTDRRGATFTIMLPIAREQQQLDAAA